MDGPGDTHPLDAAAEWEYTREELSRSPSFRDGIPVRCHGQDYGRFRTFHHSWHPPSCVVWLPFLCRPPSTPPPSPTHMRMHWTLGCYGLDTVVVVWSLPHPAVVRMSLPLPAALVGASSSPTPTRAHTPSHTHPPTRPPPFLCPIVPPPPTTMSSTA